MQSQIQKTGDRNVDQSPTSQTTIQQKAQPGAKSTQQSSKSSIQAKQRPIQAKQKPIQAKQKPIQAKQKPLQRNIGNKKSAEIASTMGQQYGVDTSNLQFNHNSSFPATVNAEATIQGNKIDFAPGKDTTDNIKHEIGHHIVNTKRGTPPKADSVVNGQTVNTSDEAAADNIMKAPLATQNEGSSVQLKANNSIGNDGPIQRIRVQDSGTGEFHDTEQDYLRIGNIEGLVALALRFLVMHNIGELRRIQQAHQQDLLNYGGYDISDNALWLMSGLVRNSRGNDTTAVGGDESQIKAFSNKFNEFDKTKFNPTKTKGYKDQKQKSSPLKPQGNMQDHRLIFAYISDQVEQDDKNGHIPDYIKQEIEKQNKQDVKFGNVPQKYRKALNKLAHTQHLAQNAFGSMGIKVVARFYTEGDLDGIKFPGLNSWASVFQDEYEDIGSKRAEVAYAHMKKGHDVAGSKVKHSPFVSVTDNLAKLASADSPFSGAINKKYCRTPGKFYSERIDKLIYGYGNTYDNEHWMEYGKDTTAVANKIAFLAVNENAYKESENEDAYAFTSHSKGVDADQDDCCVLEGENVLFAPQEYLQDIALGVVNNPMPKLHVEESDDKIEAKKVNSGSALKQVTGGFSLRENYNNISSGRFGVVNKPLHNIKGTDRPPSPPMGGGKSFSFDNANSNKKMPLNNKYQTIIHKPNNAKFGKKDNNQPPVSRGNLIYSGGKIWIVTKVNESSRYFKAFDIKDTTKKRAKFNFSDEGSTWILKR
ncbi:hypothetical protein BKI52_01320 [marine bacterium AO1-C]|nr:hypothetical protein BKI52_01320 [marine bacterium AO1-C]